MNGKNLTLIKVLGIEIKVNITWVFIAVLLAWALAQGYFPTVHEGLSTIAYWWMGAIAVIGLFASILLHELAHSVVARAHGMEIKGITLWLLGGVAEMAEEPPNPAAELLMAIAGPVVSIVLSVAFYAASRLFAGADAAAIAAVLRYLATLNMILAIFNLIPAFPLDGGRVARAALWQWKGDYRWATSVASRMGSLFGIALIMFGVFAALTGAGLGALWWVILGMFVRFAADSSRAHMEAREALTGKAVRDFMARDPITAPADITVIVLIDDYIYKHSFEFFPVVENGELLGSVSLREVRTVPEKARGSTRVRDIMVPVQPSHMIDAAAPAQKALSQMQGSGNSLLLVTSGGALVGVIALKDLMRLVNITTQLNPV